MGSGGLRGMVSDGLRGMVSDGWTAASQLSRQDETIGTGDYWYIRIAGGRGNPDRNKWRSLIKVLLSADIVNCLTCIKTLNIHVWGTISTRYC